MHLRTSSVKYYIYSLIVLLTACNGPKGYEIRDVSIYVDTRYGTEKPGNTVIGPQLPWGSINPSPETRKGGTDGYTAKMPITGFGQLHVSGTGGLGRYGNILVSPQVGLKVRTEEHDSPTSQEITNPGYYSVHLNRYDITVEISPSHYSAAYCFTFPESDSSYVSFDLSHCIPVQKNREAGIQHGKIFLNKEEGKIKGYAEYIGGWGGWTKYKVYFVAQFNKIPKKHGVWSGTGIHPDLDSLIISNPLENAGGFFGFSTSTNEKVTMKIGISLSGLQRAEDLLENEIPDWDFDRVRNEAQHQWNKVLSSILIDDPDASEQELVKFYSNYYHCFLMPRDRSLDTPYPRKVSFWDDQYCGWDTYRTLFPLMTLVKESFVKDNISSFIFRHNHLDPYVSDAFIAGQNCRVQGGDDVDVMIADASAKSIPNIDWDAAYSIMKYHADSGRNQVYNQGGRGYMFAGSHKFATSVSLEFSYNDYCIAQVAAALGKETDYHRYGDRSHGWKNLWRADLTDNGFEGFICPKRKNGEWVPDFNVRTRGGNTTFYEGSSWGYTYDLPHETDTLIARMGGKEKFIERTIHYFESGLHDWSNEPCFLMSHLFHYAGCPDLSAKYTRMGLDKFTMEGPPGNDDSGAMGSWYVLNAVGIFPVAGQDLYLLHGPIFKKITIQMENGKKIRIFSKRTTEKDIYVKSVMLNNKTLINPRLRHGDLRNGAGLMFIMRNKPAI